MYRDVPFVRSSASTPCFQSGRGAGLTAVGVLAAVPSAAVILVAGISAVEVSVAEASAGSWEAYPRDPKGLIGDLEIAVGAEIRRHSLEAPGRTDLLRKVQWVAHEIGDENETAPCCPAGEPHCHGHCVSLAGPRRSQITRTRVHLLRGSVLLKRSLRHECSK